MKKCIKQVACMLACCVAMSAAPSVPVQAATTSSVNKEAGAAYAKVIQAAQKEYTGYKKNPGGYKGKLKYFFKLSITNSSCVVYRIADLNGDKVPELLLGTKNKTFKGDGDLTAVYTYQNKKAVKLFRSTSPSGSVCLRENNVISEDTSDGETNYYKIAKNGKLKKIITVGEVFNEQGIASWYKIVNGKKTKITQTQGIKIYNKYPMERDSNFYKLTTEAIKNVKKGSFTYKGQKHWKLEM